MNNFRVQVIDGLLPADFASRADMEPRISSSPELADVTQELMQREPLFHRPEFGCTRADFEKMAAPEFWEVGATGRRYSRAFVLDTLEQRYRQPFSDTWELQDFHCTALCADTFLVTYSLIQREQTSRRSTIWKRAPDCWKIIYHQGTLCPTE